MGAFGSALIAREHYQDGYKTSMLSIEQIMNLQFETSMAKCKGCTNNSHPARKRGRDRR